MVGIRISIYQQNVNVTSYYTCEKAISLNRITRSLLHKIKNLPLLYIILSKKSISLNRELFSFRYSTLHSVFSPLG